jgi:excisionase family DNA binding protein
VENKNENIVLTTQEACHYLRISRPTYLKYLYVGKIKGVKVGKGWKVLKSELDRFLKGEDQYSVVHKTNMLNSKESEGEIW